MNHPFSVDISDAEVTIPAQEAKREIDLRERIPRLWTAHRENKCEVRRTKTELAQVRGELSAHLHEMKALLARTGRGGMWASFLREKGIPRSSADRYSAAYEANLPDSPNKRLSEALAEPLDVQIGRLIDRIQPQLLRVLTTSEAAFLFVTGVLNRLPDANFLLSDRYLEVFNHAKEPPVASS